MAAGGGGGMGRLLSLGFLFGAKDDGASSVATKISEGFSSLKGNVKSVGKSTGSLMKFGNAVNSLNFLRLSQMNDKLEGLADRAGALGGGQQATQLESFGAQFAQTWRSAAAGAGEYRDELEALRGQVSGAAFTLDIDAAEMTKGLTKILRTGNKLEDYGLTVRDVAGSMQAGILNAEQLGDVLTSLSEQYDLGTEGAKNLMDQVTAMGQRVGAGADAARSLPNVLEATNEILSSLPKTMAPSIDSSVKSITQLASATTDHLGGDFNQAMTDAISVFNTLGQQRRNVRNLLTGVSSDFPEMAQEIGIASGNIDEAMKMVMSDPVTFAENMNKMRKQLPEGSAQAQRLHSILEQLPPSFRFLTSGTEDASEAIRKAKKPIDDATGAFSEMSRAASGSTKTFGEWMDIAQDRFMTTINRMPAQLYKAGEGFKRFESEVLERQRDAYDRTAKKIEEFVSRDGLLPRLGRVALATRRGGIMGLSYAIERELADTALEGLSKKISNVMPFVEDFGGGMLEIANQTGPALLALTQMRGLFPGLGRALGLVLNPWTLLIGGLVAAVRYWDTIGPMIEEGADKFHGLSESVLKWVNGVDWENLGNQIVDGVLAAFGVAGDTLQSKEMSQTSRKIAEAFKNLFEAAGKIIKGLAKGLWDRIIGWVTEPDDLKSRASRGAKATGVVLGAAMFTPMRGPILSAAGSLLSGVGGAMMKGLKGMGGAGAFLGKQALRKIPIVGAFIGVLFDLPEIIDKFKTGDIVGALKTTYVSILDGLLLGIPSLIEKVFGTDIFSKFFGFLFEATNLGNVAREIQEGDLVGIIGESLFTLFNNAFLGVPGMVRRLFSDIFGENLIGGFWTDVVEPTFGDFWNEVLKPTLNDFKKFWENELMPIIDGAIELFDDLKVVAVEFWEDSLKPALIKIGKWWKKTWEDTIKPATIRAIERIKRGVKTMWNKVIKPVLFALARTWVGQFNIALKVSIEVFRAVLTQGVNTFYGIKTAIEVLKVTWDGVKETLQKGWKAIGTTIKNSVSIALLQAKDALLNLVNGLDMGVLRMRHGFERLSVTILEFIKDTLLSEPMKKAMSFAGIQIGTVESAVDSSLKVMKRQVRTTDQAMEDLRKKQRKRNEETAQQTQKWMKEMVDSQTAAADAAVNTSRKQRRAYQDNASAASSMVDTINERADAAQGVVRRLNDRLKKFIGDVESGAFSDRAASRRQQETDRMVRLTVHKLKQSFAAGQISEEHFAHAAERVRQSIKHKNKLTKEGAENILREVGAVPGRGSTTATDVPARARGVAKGEPGEASRRAAERRTAQLEAQRAERMLQEEMTIAGFSSQAVRQLRKAFAGTRGQPTASRGIPGSAPGGADLPT